MKNSQLYGEFEPTNRGTQNNAAHSSQFINELTPWSRGGFITWALCVESLPGRRDGSQDPVSSKTLSLSHHRLIRLHMCIHVSLKNLQVGFVNKLSKSFLLLKQRLQFLRKSYRVKAILCQYHQVSIC